MRPPSSLLISSEILAMGILCLVAGNYYTHLQASSRYNYLLFIVTSFSSSPPCEPLWV